MSDERVICDGCGEAISPRSAWLVQGDRDPLIAYVCTPHCLYEHARDRLKAETDDNIEPELLYVVAIDIFDALDGLSADSSDEKWNHLWDCAERLGIVLGQLDARPPEEVLGLPTEPT